MIDIEKLNAINPNDRYDPCKKQPFNEFFDNATILLPNFPRDVLDQWVYEAFDCFVSLIVKGIEVDRFSFLEEKWELDRVLKINDPDNFYESGAGPKINTFPVNRLMKYMNQNGTWPKPIIVFDTCNSSFDNKYEYISSHHLLEGHCRLVYLQRMCDAKLPVCPKHSVWKVIQK